MDPFGDSGVPPQAKATTGSGERKPYGSPRAVDNTMKTANSRPTAANGNGAAGNGDLTEGAHEMAEGDAAASPDPKSSTAPEDQAESRTLAELKDIKSADLLKASLLVAGATETLGPAPKNPNERKLQRLLSKKDGKEDKGEDEDADM